MDDSNLPTADPAAAQAKTAAARPGGRPPTSPQASPERPPEPPPGAPPPNKPNRSPGRRTASQPSPLPPASVPSTAAAEPEAPPIDPASPAGQRQALVALMERSRSGDPAALAEIQDVLDRRPEVWQAAGDLGLLTEAAVVDAASFDNPLVAASARRFLKQKQGELAGPDPTPLVRHLARLAAVTWVVTEHAEREAAQPAGLDLGPATFRVNRADSSLRRHLAALEMLVTVQALERDRPAR